MGLKLASDTIDSMDAVTTQWTQIFFRRDKTRCTETFSLAHQDELFSKLLLMIN
jgi:hypothetical protein